MGDPPPWVLAEHSLKECTSFYREVSIHRGRVHMQFVRASERLGENSTTALSLLLPEITKWEMTGEHEVKENTETPYISPLIIGAFDHLRGDVLTCPNQALVTDPMARPEMASQAKISKQESASIQISFIFPIIIHCHLFSCSPPLAIR